VYARWIGPTGHLRPSGCVSVRIRIRALCRSNPSTTSPLLSVATELLLAIVEAVDDAASLRNFALTCKLARLLAEPVLYRAVLVTTGSQASCLTKTLQQQQLPARAELVQALDLRPEYSMDADVEALKPLVGAMTQLRALSMESLFANYGQWRSSAINRWEALMQGYRALFLDAQCGAGLQKLESCEFFLVCSGHRC
jgi:hypothetical protein